jgi:hypothetical protein
MREQYKVATEDQFGSPVDQELGFDTHKEAQTEADECIERWGEDGQDFWVESYEPAPIRSERKYAHPNSIDGWEDIYPQED